MRILVCGGRDFGDLESLHHNRQHALWKQREAEYRFIQMELDKLSIKHSKLYNPDDNWLPSDIHIIAGDAKGADNAAIDWAICNWCPYSEFEADWAKHGYAAGPIRNKQMLDEGKPDLVVAFPGKKGTANMIRQAKKAGIPVLEMVYEG